MQPAKQDKEFWEIKKSFHVQMLDLIDEFKIQLSSQQLPAGVINGHIRVAGLFVNHINGYTDHLKFEDITVANANKKFLAHAKWEGLSDWDPKEIKAKLKRFLEFLEQKDFHNDKVLLSL